MFFATHDPTTLNRQGNDVGSQYRSEIFYTSLEQKENAEGFIALLEKEKVFDLPIVTAVSEEKPIWSIIDSIQHHQDREADFKFLNPQNPVPNSTPG